MQYSGTTTVDPMVRIIAVAGNRILATAPVDANGHWSVDVDTEPEWLIAQRIGDSIAAVAAPPQAATQLNFPDLVQLELAQQGVDTDVKVWVDPIELAGFPPQLIWSFFAEPDGLVKLHAAEISLPPGDEYKTIMVQRGRYRLSGGTIAVRPPGLGPDPVQLESVTDMTAGSRIESNNGQVVIEIKASGRYLLNFQRVTPSTNPSITIERPEG